MKKTNQIYLIIWTIIILILTGFPGNYIPKPNTFLSLISIDKIVHLFMFGPFAFLLYRHWHLNTQAAIRRKKIFLKTILIGTIYAILTESLQFYVFIGRNGNLIDLIADVIGLLIGALIYHFYGYQLTIKHLTNQKDK